MPQPEEPRHSRDVPATLRAFYPRGRVRGNAPLRLLDHTTRASWLSPARGIGPIKLLFCVEVPFFLFLLLGPIRSESWEPYGEVLPLVLYLIAILTPVFLLAHWTINAYYQGFSSLFTYRVNGFQQRFVLFFIPIGLAQVQDFQAVCKKLVDQFGFVWNFLRVGKYNQ